MTEERRMHRTVLAWARPRRWSILVEATLAVALALVSWPVLATGGDDESVEVVTGYLEALRAGDIERAEAFMANPGDTGGRNKSWLTAEAMSSDWEIESVERRSRSDYHVHATISSGRATVEGVFALETEGGATLISNPYALIDLPSDVLETFEFNGHTQKDAFTEDHDFAQLALFPGSYTLFGSLPAPADEPERTFLAMPNSGQRAVQQASQTMTGMLSGLIAGNAELEARLNEDMAAWIDGCVESSEAAPAGCPFSAADDWSEVSDGETYYDDVGPLTWEVDGYPHIAIGSNLGVETVANGWVRLSGTGTVWSDGTESVIRGRCRIDVGSIDVSMLADGRFEFAVPETPWNTCNRGLN